MNALRRFAARLLRAACRRRPVAARHRADAATIHALRCQLAETAGEGEAYALLAAWQRQMVIELQAALALQDRLAWAALDVDAYRDFFVHSRGYFLDHGADGLLPKERCARIFRTQQPDTGRKV